MEPTALKSALLVLDMQPALLPSDDAFRARVAQAVAHARTSGIPVIYVVVGFRPGAPEIQARHRARFSSLDMAEFMQIDPTVAPQPGELTVVKRRTGAFAGTDLEVVLRTLGIGQLVLTGFATSGAVLSTVCAAADQDYALTVLADACLDPDPQVQQTLIEKVFPRKATVLTVAEWCRAVS